MKISTEEALLIIDKLDGFAREHDSDYGLPIYDSIAMKNMARLIQVTIEEFNEGEIK